MKTFLSLGAGVQSSTLALMIAHGELPPINAAIFADTQWEPQHVYRWLAWLEDEIGRAPQPFPVHKVTRGSVREAALAKQNATGQRVASIPWFTRNPDGSHGMGRRQCTSEFKLQPLIRAKRELLGFRPRQRIPDGSCRTLIGISTDEAVRMRESSERWNVNAFPLIDLGMSRRDCLSWMRARGFPEPPKSSCLGCPFHSDAEWRRIKADPQAWADVVEIDRAIRAPVRGMRGEQFMHAARIPLKDVDFSTAEERGQVNMFNNECEGMCGV